MVNGSTKPKMTIANKTTVLTMAGIGATFNPIRAWTKRSLVAV